MYHKFIIVLVLILSGCMRTNTSDPEEAYRYWSGGDVPQDVKVYRGRFSQTPHFTLEYEVYLKIKPTATWWNRFVKENNLADDYSIWEKPSDSPIWFNPPENCQVYKLLDDANRSRYFQDPTSGVCYIYETVGM